MTELVVGTDRRTLLTVSSSTGSDGRTSAVPAGVRHAVPRGRRIALCGEAPAVCWEGEAWPGRAHEADICPVCSSIQRTSRRTPRADR